MKLFIFILSYFLIFVGCIEQGKNPGLDHSQEVGQIENKWDVKSSDEWLKNKGLLNVESIIFDEENSVFYTTSGMDYKVSTDGFISKISENGELQNLKWVSGLNRPTGMAIKDSVLYVADVNSLVAINTKNGKVLRKYTEPIAKSGLNDVAINEKGEVYVSASFIHAVLKLMNGKLELWIKDDKALQWANGLIANNDQVVVAGLKLNSISIVTEQVTAINLNPTIKDFDGIKSDYSGGYFLTTVENSGLYHLNEKNKVNKLLDGDAYFGDLEYNPTNKNVYIPRGDKENGTFYISVLTVE